MDLNFLDLSRRFLSKGSNGIFKLLTKTGTIKNQLQCTNGSGSCSAKYGKTWSRKDGTFWRYTKKSEDPGGKVFKKSLLNGSWFNGGQDLDEEITTMYLWST